MQEDDPSCRSSLHGISSLEERKGNNTIPTRGKTTRDTASTQSNQSARIFRYEQKFRPTCRCTFDTSRRCLHAAPTDARTQRPEQITPQCQTQKEKTNKTQWFQQHHMSCKLQSPEKFHVTTFAQLNSLLTYAMTAV